MKRFVCLILTAMMLISALPIAAVAQDILLIAPAPTAAKALTADAAAEKLYRLGLLQGMGLNADGTVDFATEGDISRAQAIVQVVRFYGAEETAKAQTNAHPFTDLPTWAVPYVSYAYANGFTKGVTDTAFDCDSKISDASFLTYILRVLGYDDVNAGDFVWNNPYDLAKKVGLIDSTTPNSAFKRGDAFIICYNALTATAKSGSSIKDQLIGAGVFTAEKYSEVDSAVITTPERETVLRSINELNTESTVGSHANDSITTASLELNYREKVELSSAKTGQTRYDNAWYPRIKQVKDDLYVLFFMYSQFGRHLYYATSSDGLNWNAPAVLWAADNSKKFTYTEGSFTGKEDQYLAVNADACVLDNGDILCVYSVRPSSGYGTQEYIEYNGIFMKRGTVDENNNITWSEEQKIYTGQVWEPFIWQRENGQIELYWSCAVAYIDLYGFDKDKRSTCTSMLVSNDNGYSWTPDFETCKENNYVGMRVYQEYVGDKVPYSEDGKYTEAVPYFGGQMPAATALLDGRTLLAIEVHELDKDFHISLATSDENGNWKNLGIHETNENAMVQAFDGEGSSPYLATFPSGEVYLTYGKSGIKGRMISPDATVIDKEFEAIPDIRGSWGATEIINSHKVATVNPASKNDVRSIIVAYSYLNHRINAKKISVNVDGYTNDWLSNTDALFIGSETQAQTTLSVAHDNDNVYFLINRLDYYLTEGDTSTINIAVGTSSYYRLLVDLSGNVTATYVENGTTKSTVTLDKAAVELFGTLGNNEDKDEGAVIELKVAKSAVGLSGNTSFAVRPELANQDGSGSTADTLTGVSSFNSSRWPSVVLD